MKQDDYKDLLPEVRQSRGVAMCLYKAVEKSWIERGFTPYVSKIIWGNKEVLLTSSIIAHKAAEIAEERGLTTSKGKPLTARYIQQLSNYHWRHDKKRSKENVEV